MRRLFSMLLLLLAVSAGAQTKVFKEVSEDVSSEMKIITQDNSLVGYLVFTRLEKASEDSFNYRISLMDENLNDIGVVNFREESLNLQAASFEQDVLCLAYLKSNSVGKTFANKKELENFKEKNFVMTQFLTLDGKIIKTNSDPVELKKDPGLNYLGKKQKFVYNGMLALQIQLKTIPGLGFVCLYGDQSSRYLAAYDASGNQLWKNDKIKEGSGFGIMATGRDVYVLRNGKMTSDTYGYNLHGFSAKDGKENYEVALKDTKGNTLRVVNWNMDPSSGKLYITGNIINMHGRGIYNSNDIGRRPYLGVFTMDANGPDKKDLKFTYSYWSDGSQSSVISEKGKVVEKKSYMVMYTSFRDYSGNTFYVGTEFIKRPKYVPLAVVGAITGLGLSVGSIGVGIMGAAMVLPWTGTKKWKARDAMILKMTPKGMLSYETTFPASNSKFVRGIWPVERFIGNRGFYNVNNEAAKTNYIVSIDPLNVTLYNLKKKKVVRTIDQKDGKIQTAVFPAKEGHIMVVETNKKEKYVRLSIEPLN